MNCGAGNEWNALEQAREDMGNLKNLAPFNSQERADYKSAYLENVKSLDKFTHTDVWKSWVTGGNALELCFQARAKAWCGHEYSGD